MNEWYSYPSIYNLGHKAVKDIFDNKVNISEKLDGSQFSVLKINNEVQIYSKRCRLYKESSDKMFSKAVQYIYNIGPLLKEGYLYRAEYLQNPRHNCLVYNRTPKNNLMLFDVCNGYENYLDPEDLLKEADRLDIDAVPLFFDGRINDIEQIKELIEKESYLGGPKVEGIVIKAYDQFGPDKKTLMAKIRI